MDVGTPILLRGDAVIVPVADLDPEIRRRFNCDDDDFVVSRTRSRAGSLVVDGQGAAFLRHFAGARTITDAVILYSLPRGLDSEAILAEVLPLVHQLVRHGVLVDADDRRATRGHAGDFEPGETIDIDGSDWNVVRSVQTLDDGQVVQVRRGSTFAALKVTNPSSPNSTVRLLENEAVVLKHLATVDPAASMAPRLLNRGEHDGQSYVLLEWCRGVVATAAAAEWRERPDHEGDRGLLALCRATAHAYAKLHDHGVLHGDVHPRNLLVDRDGSVQLIDFGLACTIDAPVSEPRDVGRPGVAFYQEPEVARAVLAGTPPPDPSESGEQFAVGALLYQVVTGAHYRDFGLERQDLLRQIAEDPPLAFADRGQASWPTLEAVLGRALAKEPGARFPSMSAMADALDAVDVPETKTMPSRADHLTHCLDRFLDQTALDAPWFTDGLPRPPTASINQGAAGVALALYRIACQREDGELLARADVWACRAEQALAARDGLQDPSRDVGVDQIGTVSPYHTASGIHTVHALIAGARNDHGTFDRALASFVAASRDPANTLDDLTLGRAGSLLGCALLDDVRRMLDRQRSEALLDLARTTGDELWRRLDERPSIAESVGDYLGIAHGWAGYLYATLQWCRASQSEPPARLVGRLDELAALAEPIGRGARWPWNRSVHSQGPNAMPGWCHGSAGYVFLWSLAHRVFEKPTYRERAHDAAWNAWEAGDRNPTLCCGLAGRAYALLCHGRATGDARWYDRANDLAQQAAREDRFEADDRHTLYKGDIALAVLAADLARPEYAAMPFFEVR